MTVPTEAAREVPSLYRDTTSDGFSKKSDSYLTRNLPKLGKNVSSLSMHRSSRGVESSASRPFDVVASAATRYSGSVCRPAVSRQPSCNTTAELRKSVPFEGNWYQWKRWCFWNLARGDIDILTREVQLFPLRFNSPIIEAEFTASLAPSYPPRCLLIGISGAGWCCFILPMDLITLHYHYVTLFRVAVPFVTTMLLVGLLSFVLLALIPWVPKLQNHPERWTLICLCITWLCGAAVHCVLSAGMLLYSDPVNVLLINLWVESGTAGIWLWGVLVMDSVIRTRTRYTLLPHILLGAIVLSPTMVQYVLPLIVTRDIGSARLGFIMVLRGIQSSLALTLLTVGYLARIYRELQERVEFLRIRNNRLKIHELVEKNQKTRAAGATVVEELTNVIEKARHLVQGIGLESNNVKLHAADKMLFDCLESLGNTDELYAVRFQPREVNNPLTAVETQFYNLYTNKVARRGVQYVKDLSRGTDEPHRMTSDVHSHGGARTNGYTSRPSTPRYDVSSFVDTHDPTVSHLRRTLGVSPVLNLLQLHSKSPTLFVSVGFLLLEDYIDVLGGAPQLLVQFLKLSQATYLANPYHNECHGMVVAHVATCFVRLLRLFQGSVCRGWEAPILTLSALCHDVGHPGGNNALFVNSNHRLALVFNDLSVLENYHSFLTFCLLQRSDTNLLRLFSLEEIRDIRKRIIELILATDMAQHFEAISRFRLRRKNAEFDFREDLEDMWMVARMCVKAADLSHGFMEWKPHVEWSVRIAEEFYQQGDMEASCSLPVSPLCERKSHKEFAKSQKGFLEFVIQPLIKELEEIDPSGGIAINWTGGLFYNKYRWEQMANDTENPEIPSNIRALKSLTKDPLILLKSAFLELTASHYATDNVTRGTTTGADT